MKTYTDEEIKDRLFEIDYPNNEHLISGVLERIHSFGPQAAEKFEYWMETGKMVKFEVGGISSDFLKKHHKMKDVALIIAFDWLNKSPQEATRLLKKPIIISSK